MGRSGVGHMPSVNGDGGRNCSLLHRGGPNEIRVFRLGHKSWRLVWIVSVEYPHLSARVAPVVINVRYLAGVFEEAPGLPAARAWAIGHLMGRAYIDTRPADVQKESGKLPQQ
jgi:hypothetical protein